MKKKGMTMIASIAGLVCLFGAYSALRSHNRQAEEQEAQEALGETILTLNTEKIVSASFPIEEEQYTFEKREDGWHLSTDDTFPADGDALAASLAKFSEIRAFRTLEGIDDTSEFGMDAPQSEITLKTEDGTEIVLTIGAVNEATGDDYLMLNDAPSTVYTVASTVQTAFSDDLYDYARSEELPEFTEENVVGIEWSSPEQSYQLYKEDDAWRFAEEDADAEESSAADAASELLAELSGLSYVDYLEHNCADFAPYGLEKPSGTLTVTVQEDSGESVQTTLYIGSTDEAGNYYTRLGDSKEVHAIASSAADAFKNGAPEMETETETISQ